MNEPVHELPHPQVCHNYFWVSYHDRHLVTAVYLFFDFFHEKKSSFRIQCYYYYSERSNIYIMLKKHRVLKYAFLVFFK